MGQTRQPQTRTPWTRDRFQYSIRWKCWEALARSQKRSIRQVKDHSYPCKSELVRLVAGNISWLLPLRHRTYDIRILDNRQSLVPRARVADQQLVIGLDLNYSRTSTHRTGYQSRNEVKKNREQTLGSFATSSAFRFLLSIWQSLPVR